MINPIKDQPKKYGYKFRQKTWYSKYHFGVDYILPKGSPVYAPVSGIAKHFTGSQSGTAVYLQGDDGKIHRLMHMSKRACKDNERVEEGQLIGYVGSTGMSTGSHLHWDVYNGKGLRIQNFVDPEDYLKASQNNMTAKEELQANYSDQGDLRRDQIAAIEELSNLMNSVVEMVEKMDDSIKEQSILRAKEKEIINRL